MKTHTPRVSVGVPVYNGQNYLPAALDCLLEQTYEDFELIISDNASTDSTSDICLDYSSRDKRIRYVRQEQNLGMAANFNVLVQLARGEYFRWAAHDDVCDRSFLAKAVDVLDRKSDVVLCASKTALVDAQGTVMRPSDDDQPRSGPVLPPLTPRRFDVDSPHKRFQDILMNSVWGIEFYGLIRTEVLRTTELHRPYCLAEKVLLTELALRGRFYELPDVLLFMRYHQEQASNVNSTSGQSKLLTCPRGWRPSLPYRVQSSCGYFAVVRQAPLPFTEKLRCLAALARYFVQVHKWKRVFREAVTGSLRTAPANQVAPRS